MPKDSKIFVGYRALGFVSNDIPLSLRYINRRNENLVVTSVGKSFHTYSCTKLNLLSVSGQHPTKISCLTSDSYLVFTACENFIYAWRRGTELKHKYQFHATAHLMLPFGPHLIAVYDDNTFIMWDIKTEEIFSKVLWHEFQITAICHPSTYLNKILFGSWNGRLQLWNLKTSKLIYTFNGWNSPVNVLEQAPAIDVIGIGLDNGKIYIHNIKVDETIMKFHQDWGCVTAISFRTDGPPIMASASTEGHIAVWDLEKKRLHSEIRDAHDGFISNLKFLPNEPLLITNSSDNSIKMWIFDQPDDSGRLLRLREGHSLPPTKIKFYGANGKNILSGGLDSTLRSFSTETDNMNKNLGQASYNRKAAKKKGIKNDSRKMSPIVDFAAESTREKDWDNIAAVHRQTEIVTTWSYDRSCMGQHKLIHNRFKGIKNVEASCVSISSCGNFVVIGYNTGHLDKFNIQSGIHRGSFGKDTAHDGHVRGIVLDGLSNLAVSGGSDKHLKFWNFKDLHFISSIIFDYSIAKMIIHRESAMVAVALDNFSVSIIDLESKRTIRIFDNHEGSISDMAFSPDSRWLIVATMDSAIKTWDLPSGKLIDWILVSSVCTSLSMSPTGEYLATTHAGKVGVYLWANSTLYSNVSLHPLSDEYDPLNVDLPVIALEGREASDCELYEMDVEPPDEEEFKSPDQITDKLATLSLLPQSHWLNILDLDIIKLRNKPKEPVRTPKRAPFFLPVVSGLKPTFMVEETKHRTTDDESSRVLQVMQHGSEFFQLLENCAETGKYDLVMEALKSFSPSKIDVEIRCLSPENGGSIHLMKCFLMAMLNTMKTNRNFELVHSYLALFLQVHFDQVASESSLLAVLEELKNLRSWESLQEIMNCCLCFGNYSRSAVL